MRMRRSACGGGLQGKALRLPSLLRLSEAHGFHGVQRLSVLLGIVDTIDPKDAALREVAKRLGATVHAKALSGCGGLHRARAHLVENVIVALPLGLKGHSTLLEQVLLRRRAKNVLVLGDSNLPRVMRGQ